MDVDDFAPRLSFFFDVHNDFFEEIAKFRAARRMWARIMKERFGAKKLESLKLRTHAQTAGVSLTAQQPYNNVVRVALQALAAVLGGTQSLHTNSLDETYALPTEDSVTIALRTQQIVAEESGVAGTIDPLGGSWFVEDLTNRLEAEATRTIKRIDEMGGVVEAIEKGYPQREIAASAYRFQRQLEAGERVMVGVNKYASEGGKVSDIPLLRIDEEVMRTQVANLKRIKETRDAAKVKSCLEAVKVAAEQAGRQRGGEPDAADHRGGQGVLHAAGDLRRAARGDGDVHGSGGVLKGATLSANVAPLPASPRYRGEETWVPRGACRRGATVDAGAARRVLPTGGACAGDRGGARGAAPRPHRRPRRPSSPRHPSRPRRPATSSRRGYPPGSARASLVTWLASARSTPPSSGRCRRRSPPSACRSGHGSTASRLGARRTPGTSS